MIIDAASERREQGRFLRGSTGNSNAVLASMCTAHESIIPVHQINRFETRGTRVLVNIKGQFPPFRKAERL
jgi:hypothetical protein